MQQYFLPSLQQGVNRLGADESHHIIKVMRLHDGDTLMLTNGMGVRAECRIIHADLRGAEVETIQWTNFPSATSEICLAISPLKHPDRFEWLVEKATELGVSRIIPMVCKRTEKNSIRRDRLMRVINAAAVQSLRAWFPILDDAKEMSEVVSMPFDGVKAIAWCEGDNRVDLMKALRPNSSSLLLVGPEGDFSADEVSMAIENGFAAVTLGDLRLRSETAGLFMVQAAKMILG